MFVSINPIMPSAVMLNVLMLSVVMLGVFILSVVIRRVAVGLKPCPEVVLKNYFKRRHSA
jgi:hypothetical protein